MKECPYCHKDMSSAIRLLGDEVFNFHLRLHENDLIQAILYRIDLVHYYYSVQAKEIPPWSVAQLFESYEALREFNRILDEGEKNE